MASTEQDERFIRARLGRIRSSAQDALGQISNLNANIAQLENQLQEKKVQLRMLNEQFLHQSREVKLEIKSSEDI